MLRYGRVRSLNGQRSIGARAHHHLVRYFVRALLCPCVILTVRYFVRALFFLRYFDRIYYCLFYFCTIYSVLHLFLADLFLERYFILDPVLS